MKDFVGKQVEFFVEGVGRFKATVVADRPNMVHVKGENDRFARRIPKSKICSFMPLEPVGSDVNLLVLSCENPTIGCPGVRFVKEGEGFSRNDFNVFMQPCPHRCETCRTGSLGELRSVDGESLREMMDGTMFGDYPEVRNGKGELESGGVTPT